MKGLLPGFALLVPVLVLAGLGPERAPFDPDAVGSGPALASPGGAFVLGTDELGRDILSRVLSGARVTLMVGLAAAAAASLMGILVGASAGFLGGIVDDLLMRVTEIFQILPRFFLAVMLVAFFGPSLANVIVAVAVLSWPQLARIVRSEFLTLRSREYVEASRAAGAGSWAIMFQKILPNALGPAVATGTLLVGQAILIEAGLSYLGLGDPSRVSLGLMLQEAQSIMRTAPWATAFPGLVIFLTVLGVNVLGDALTERTRRET